MHRGGAPRVMHVHQELGGCTAAGCRCCSSLPRFTQGAEVGCCSIAMVINAAHIGWHYLWTVSSAAMVASLSYLHSVHQQSCSVSCSLSTKTREWTTFYLSKC